MITTNTQIIFNKTTNKEEFENVLFVMKALSEKNSADFTNVIHAENARIGSRIIATDGKRLHVALLQDRIPEGNYRVRHSDSVIVLLRETAPLHYPSWKNVIPEKTRLKADIDLSTTDEIGTIQAMEKLSVANTIIVRKTGRSINFQFLSDLAEMKWKLYAGGSKTQPVVFRKVNQEETVFAVLAPLSA